MNKRNELEQKLKNLEAELEVQDVIQGGLKIYLNGSYGKFGSQYSKLYSPDLLLQTTMTGQLTLLMLIEELELEGISVMSANTDGVEAHCPTKKDKKRFREITEAQGKAANLGWEFGSYSGLFARDVNNYVAKYDGYVKSKGVFSETSLMKNVETPIVFEAVREIILNGTPLKETITNCTDVKQFLSAQTVNGGAYFGTPIFGEPVQVIGSTGKPRMEKVVIGWEEGSVFLGKVVRYYYSKKGGSIHRKGNGNLVSMTEGCRPMMELTKKLPKDLNVEWYIQYAERMLKDLGYEEKK